MKPSAFTITCGFAALFACYHAAEYSMLTRNSPLGFLAVSLLFFPLAYRIARWQVTKTSTAGD
jgi:uncharacterized protein